MAQIQQRGLDSTQEQSTTAMVRDTRTIGQRISDFLGEPSNVAIVISILAVGGFVIPGIVDILFVISIFLFIYGKTRRFSCSSVIF